MKLTQFQVHRNRLLCVSGLCVQSAINVQRSVPANHFAQIAAAALKLPFHYAIKFARKRL